MSLTHHAKQMNIQLEKLLTIGGAAIIGASCIAVFPADAESVHVNGNGGDFVVYTGPVPRSTTIRYDSIRDNVKLCREHYYGTQKCVKWSY